MFSTKRWGAIFRWVILPVYPYAQNANQPENPRYL